MEAVMSGCFSGSHLELSAAIINYLMFLVCKNNIDVLGDINKIIYSTFDYVALYLLFIYFIINYFSVFLKNCSYFLRVCPR